MKSIRLQSVSRVFGRTFALHRVSLELEPGTLTGLVGDNGAGKTTLLNILATLDKPSDGEVHFGRHDWTTFAQKGRHKIGWVSHDSLVYGELTGRENLEFFATMYGLGDGAALADRWLERVGLTRAADRRVNAYSRGMKQRLTLARALLHEPAILLLDEPMTGLDQDGRREMSELFMQLRDEGRLLVLITHSLDMLEGLADRLAVLRRGKLTHFGPVEADEDVADTYKVHA
ncbi:ABC transporter ATP-binding protein [Persicimonas caeni]|uniref:ABC transporter ATP-binding protein n=1 Tax=Persicimonas caeni TaxID=2292766 RepID=A0A4Y6PY03_PERCE|nr:ABC transporter ATP-binding protein [Persicimonas caeni]QDG53196.1 ABC transporter ATP-binding protein [Persicimonas caeni]QED34418.1 ABC transporter ATP-binding protein [Persicimonas caeni]